MRFTGVDIPQGSKIVGAHLEMMLHGTTVASRIDGVVQAEAVGNSAGFSATERHICGLPLSNASVAWVWEVGN
jgi:hypothetical protein